jgi:hypothetical protein
MNGALHDRLPHLDCRWSRLQQTWHLLTYLKEDYATAIFFY